jgi:HSP20 family protein
MSQNLLPDILDRPLRSFPGLMPNWLTSWNNLLEDDLMSRDLTTNGVRIYEENNQLHVELPLPGLNLKDIEVSLNKGVLLVKGSSIEEEKDKKRKYYRSAKRSYSYSLALPSQIDEKQEPQAIYGDGILNISLQLAKQAETKKITVTAGKKEKAS